MHMSSNDDGWDDESIAAFNNTLNRLMNDMNADTERVSFAEDRFLLRQFDDELSRTLAPAPGGSGEECVDGWRKPSPDHFERHHDSSVSRPGSSSQGTDTRSYRNVMHTLLTQLIHLSLSEREAARMVYTRAKVEDLYGVRGFKKLLTQCDMILPSDSQLQVMLVDAHRTLVVEEPPAPLGRHLHPCHSNGGMDGWHTARTLAKALLTGRRSRRSSARGPSLFPAAAATDASGGARSNRLSSVVSPDASPSSSLPSGHGGGGGSVTQRGGSARGTGQSSQSSSDDIFISLQVFWFCLERLKRRQYDELVEHDVQAVESVLQEAIEAIMTDSAFIDELPVTESNQQATGSGRSNATVGSATDIGGDAGKITPVRLDEYLSHVFGVKLFASDVSSSDAAPTTSLPSMSMQPSLSMVASWASKLKHDEEAAAHHGVLGPTELLSALNQNGEPPPHVTKNSDDIFGTHHHGAGGDAQHTLHLQGIASRMRSAVFLQRGGRHSSSLAVDDGSDGNVTMMHNHHVPMLALQRPSMGSPLLPPSGVDTSSSHRYSLAPVTLGHSPRSNSPHSSTRQQKSIVSTLFLAAPSGTVRGSVSPTTSTPASARSSSDDNRPSMHEGDSVIVAMAPPAAAPRPSTLSNSPTGSRPPTGTSSPFDTSRNRKVNPYVSTAFLPMPSLMDTSNVVEPQRSQINILEDSSHQQQPVLISRTSSSVNMWSPGQSRPGTAGGGSTDTGSPVGSPTSSLRDMRREAASRKQQYQVRMERLKADILSQMTHDHARRSCHSASSPTQRRGRRSGGSPVRPASATVGVSKSERSAAAAVGDDEEEVSRSYSPLNDPHVARYYGAHGNSNIYCRAALLSRPNSSTAASSAKATHDGENNEANDLPAVVTSTTTRQQQQQRPVVGDKINARCVSAGVRGPRIATQVREYALVALEHLATDLNALRSCPPKKEHKPRKSLPLVCRRV